MVTEKFVESLVDVHPFHFLSVPILFLWHVERTFVALPLPWLVTQLNDLIVWPQKFVGMIPVSLRWIEIDRKLECVYGFEVRFLVVPVYCRYRRLWSPFAPNAFAGTTHNALYGSFHACPPYLFESTFHVILRNRNEIHFQLKNYSIRNINFFKK